MDETLRTRNVQMLSSLGNGLKRQFELQKFCDVTLTTTNKSSGSGSSALTTTNQNTASEHVTSVECHKVVLASTTKHFEHYLSSRGNEVNIIDVSPIPADTLKETLTFLYNGECLINEVNVFALLDVANTWVVPELAADCCRFIISARTVENVCSFYEGLRTSERSDTSAELCDFIRENFMELYENQQIACLSLASFNNVIAVDAVKVDKEDMVFAGAVLVIDNHPGAVDQEDLAKCWQLIRFERMSITYLVDTVMYHELMRDAPQHDYVKQAVTHLSRQDSSISTSISTARTWVTSNAERFITLFTKMNRRNPSVCYEQQDQ